VRIVPSSVSRKAKKDACCLDRSADRSTGIRLGFSLSRILFSEKSICGQMQDVGRMDIEQLFFCRLFRGEVARLPTPSGNLFDQDFVKDLDGLDSG
jgi:hypothetical protein